MNEVLNYAQEVFGSILLALLSLIGVIIIYYINKAKNKIIAETDKINDEALQNLITLSIENIDKLVKTTVYSIEQETASEIRKRIASGDTSVSRDDLVALKDQVYSSVVETINPKMLECASMILGDVHKYILDKISEEVKNLKDSQNASEGF